MSRFVIDYDDMEITERSLKREIFFGDKSIGEIVDMMKNTMEKFQMALRFVMYPIHEGMQITTELTHSEHVGSEIRIPKKALMEMLSNWSSVRSRIYEIEEAYEALAMCVEALENKLWQEKMEKMEKEAKENEEKKTEELKEAEGDRNESN